MLTIITGFNCNKDETKTFTSFQCLITEPSSVALHASRQLHYKCKQQRTVSHIVILNPILIAFTA